MHIKSRPKICLKNFDKDLLLLVQTRINSPSLNFGESDIDLPLEQWYDTITQVHKKSDLCWSTDHIYPLYFVPLNTNLTSILP